MAKQLYIMQLQVSIITEDSYQAKQGFLGRICCTFENLSLAFTFAVTAAQTQR